MNYLCDQMLGTLAKWLRFFGFDTFYANSEISDNKLLDIAKKEDRFVITRDKELIIRCKKNNLKYIEIITIDLDEQINRTLKNVKIDETVILSRCSICNTILNNINKKNIKNMVPKRIFKSNEKFWFCPKCKKAYWKGTHYDKIIEKINDIKKQT